MSLQAKTYLNLLAGALAGLLTWTLTDATGWFADVFQANHVVRLGLFSGGKLLLYGIIFGALLGLLLALVDSLALDRRRQGRALGTGAAAGAVAGWLGLGLGQSVYGVLHNATGLGAGEAPHDPGQFLVLVAGRALGYALIGGMVGAAQGAASRSAIIARQGAFGGFVGGFLGGTAFQVLAGLDFPPSLSRLLALAATGALAGFFVGLVQNLFKQAWVRVVLGRNEGKEYLIAKPITTLGRSELADIGLFGDPSIAPTHAVIESLPAQGRHRLRAVMEGKPGDYAPPTVNGQPVSGEQWLADGDTVQIGTRTLRFSEVSTRKGAASAAPSAPLPARPAARYVGEEISDRPSLTTPPDVVAQMGRTPSAGPASGGAAGEAASGEATVLSGPGFGGLGTRLVAVAGPYAGQSFPLSHSAATIGRAPERDIPLPADSSVSRSHARITYTDGRHYLADDGSSNGTFVNGGRVSEPRLLSSGDTVSLAETVFRYE